MRQWGNCIDRLIEVTALPQKQEAITAIIKENAPVGCTEAEIAEVQAVWDS